jgi:NADH pyrophosphatase NudC (nudix superfamily)
LRGLFPFTLEVGEIDDGQWFDIQKVTQRVKTNAPSITDTFKT